jgi:Phage Head-Tail Attachment
MFDENLSQFFADKDFAVKAKIGSKTFDVIFDSPTHSVDIFDTSIEADSPRLSCKTSDLNGVKRGQSVIVDNKTFKIEKITNDGTGVSYLYLK